MKKKVLVILNPASNREKTKKIIPFLREELTKKKVNFDLYITQRPMDAADIVKKHRHHEHTDIIAIGGDGTFNEVLNGMKKNDVPLGFICTGSGNDFGKLIVKNQSIEEQIETAIHGQIKKIDIGICNGRHFINGVGIGFDGKVVEELMKNGKKMTGHWAYLSVVLKLLFNYKESIMTIKYDKKTISEKTLVITIGNGTTFGGGFELTPYAKLDDGLFDVCHIKPLGVIGRYINFQKVLKGTHNTMDVVNMFRTKKIFIESTNDTVAHIDGEFLGPGPYDIKILPKFLNIRVPN